MNPLVGWSLAALAIAAGWVGWGWPGVALGATVVVFWLLLQFNRAVRTMRAAAQRPVGLIDSAVMLKSRLSRGSTMLQVVPLTKSLGRRMGDEPERWAWHDAAGHEVHTEWRAGKLDRWELVRAAEPAANPPTEPSTEPSTEPTTKTAGPAPSPAA